jgi:hypothetical protein
MKIFLIVIFVLLILFLAFQMYTTMATSKTETQDYQVVQVEEKFEIRYYPSATMAMVTSNLKSYRDLGSSGFGKLAKYIFGGNNENKQIAMTSPVHMDIGDSISTMAFVMPSSYNKENLPTPNNAEIVIETSAPEYVAAIKFGGFADTERINEHKAILENALKDKGISYYGNFRYLGYNPPYQMFGRRNEVIVAIHWDSK